MALTTPILFPVAAFDATQAMTFTFNVVGGNQVTANKFTVRNNVTNATVYEQTVTTYAYTHTVPANSLTNNVYYNAFVQTIDASGNTSSASVPIQFYCYSTPVITITNMPPNNFIANSSFTFEAQYAQAEGELLNSYQFNLYNLSNTIISSSNTVYINDTTPPPTIFSHTFSGFDDGSRYYIEIVGQTIDDTVITTGKIEIEVKYEQPNIFALVSLENNACNGYITITSNMVAIEGKSNPDPPEYTDWTEWGTSVIVYEEGYYVLWDSGYQINGDFTIGLWGSEFKEDSTIFTMWTNANTDSNPEKLVLNYRTEYDEYAELGDDPYWRYFELYVYSGNNIPAYYFSESFPNSGGLGYGVFIRRINNVYELVARKSEWSPPP